MKAFVSLPCLFWLHEITGFHIVIERTIQRFPPLQATSSSDLKDNTKRRKFPRDSVVTRLQQASQRAAQKKKAQQESLFHNKPEETATLAQLMRAIDDQLLESSSSSTIMGLNRPSHPARDSMTALLMHNDRSVSSLAKDHNSEPTQRCSLSRTVAIVLCKPKINDRISLEQTIRIRRLIAALRDGELERPYLVLFVGSDSSQDSMEYYQSMVQNENLPRIKCIAEATSIPDGGLETIADYFRDDLETLAVRLKRRRIHFHMRFALISSDYHLCVLNDIHVRSPSQSFLQCLEHWEVEQSGPAFRPPKLTISTSWYYLYASTVDMRSSDENLMFVSVCYRRAQQLIPVLMNLRAVCANREFFQRDNYRVLVQVRRSFITDIERLYNDTKALVRVREHLTPTGKPLDIVLEEALLSLGRCSDLVRPAGMLTGSVPLRDFELSVTVLEHAITQISLACDPDQPWPNDG